LGLVLRPDTSRKRGWSLVIAEERLEPGERLDKLKIKPSVPRGTPAGDAIQSVLTFFTTIDP
jgi:hypothetical protein